MTDATQSAILEDWCYVDALGRPRRRKSPLKRITAKILVTANGCHEFQGARNDVNYGQVCVRTKLMYTHRVMWIAHHGPIEDGLCVLHHCDNPPCCNVEHLFLGTKHDNIVDMLQKSRGSYYFGADHPGTKLSQEDRAAIIKARAEGASLRALGRQFGVASSSIHRALKQASS